MGGAIFVGTSGINREDCKPTLDHFLRNHLHPAGINTYRMIGSTGKKTVSRDADITVEIPMGDSKPVFKERLERFLSTALGSENVRKMGSNIHVKYPIFNLSEGPTGKYVQVDIMPGENINHTSWLFAGVDENGIQGAYRNALINLIARKKSDAACTTERKVKYAIAYPGGLQVRVDGNPQTFLMEGRETVRTEDPAKILEVLDINLHPDMVLTFEGLLNYMASHSTFRDYLFDFEDYIGPKLKRDPVNARKAVDKVNEVLNKTSSRLIREYISRIIQEANTKCKRPPKPCFPNMTGGREGVKIGKLVEFSVLDALLGSPRGGNGELPVPGTFEDTPDAENIFTDPSLSDDERKTIFALYRAAYTAVTKNPIFREGLGRPLITTIGQDTGMVDVPTDISDIHVKFNEEVKGGRFGNIRKLKREEPTPEELEDKIFGAVSGYYSRDLYDQATKIIFDLHMKDKLTDYLRDESGSVDANQMDGRFVRPAGTLARDGLMESGAQREEIAKFLDVTYYTENNEKFKKLSSEQQEEVTRIKNLIYGPVQEANTYRKNRLPPDEKDPQLRSPRGKDKEYISWKDPKGAYANLISTVKDPEVKEKIDDLMKKVDTIFRKFNLAKEAYQEAMKPTYEDLAKLLSGEQLEIGEIKHDPPTLSGRPFTEVFKDDIMAAFFDIRSDMYGKIPGAKDLLGAGPRRETREDSSTPKTIIVLRVCWLCKEEVTVIIEKFDLENIGGAKGFLDNLKFEWITDGTTLKANVGPSGNPYFSLKARNDGKSTGPQILGMRGWKSIVKSEFTTATTTAPLEISVDDTPEEVPEEIEEPIVAQPENLSPEEFQPEEEQAAESLRRLVRSILREA